MSANAGEEGVDNNEWTRIVRKGRPKNNNHNNKKKEASGRSQPPQSSPPAAGPVEHFLPNPSPTLSAADIRAEHDQVATTWRATPACRSLRVLLRGVGRARVRRAVCLGLGAFEPADGAWVARRRAHVQLAAFLTMVAVLEEEQEAEEDDKAPIECFYQEPRFSQPDKAFLATLGGTVVESPEAYELVDETTLVFGVHLYRDIWAAALAKRLPAMFVGTGWEVWEESPGAEKSADFERIRQMDAGAFAKFAFPQDDYSSFSSTCIYWKNRDE